MCGGKYGGRMSFGDGRGGGGSSPGEASVSRMGEGCGGEVRARGATTSGGEVPSRRCCDRLDVVRALPCWCCGVEDARAEFRV